MNRLFSTKSLIACAIALGAIVAGSAAHARTDVTLVVNAPQRHAQPAPVLVQHVPQTVQYGHDRDRFDHRDHRDRRATLRDADRDGIPNMYDRDSRFYDARATRRHAQWGDFDRDGVANQFDRAPRNPRRH
ncbi:MAG TPA: hypothetical protein VLJ58_10775 [Ramlibacter sp.]|nr:hypothetical protein [Ramlibacter sp.]